MKKRLLTSVLALCLALSLGAQAAEPVAAQTLNFDELAQTLAQQSPTLKMLELQVDAALHNDSMDAAIDALWQLYAATGDGAYVDQALQLSNAVYLKEGDKLKLEIQQQQTVKLLQQGAQQLYLGYFALERQMAQTGREQAALGRNIETLEKSVQLGAAPEMSLLQAKQGMEQLTSGLKSMQESQQDLLWQMNLMLGRDFDAALTLTELPQGQTGFLDGRDEQADLALAVKNNFTLRLSQNALKQIKTGSSQALQKQKRAAQLQVEQDTAQVKYDFAKAKLGVTAAERGLEDAKSAYAYQQKVLQEAHTRFRLGMLSQNEYLTAQETCQSAETAVAEKNAALLSAQQSYLHLIDGLNL